jgi:hypothetical protein
MSAPAHEKPVGVSSIAVIAIEQRLESRKSRDGDRSSHPG